MSGGGKGKGGSQETEVKLPKEISKAAAENQAMVKEIAKLPYAPNFGLTTAAFTPMQEAAFQGTNSAASAFGMPTSQGTGLPKAENVGGFSGYSTEGLYNDSLSRMDPATKAAYEAFLQNPYGASAADNKPKTASATGGKQAGKGNEQQQPY